MDFLTPETVQFGIKARNSKTILGIQNPQNWGKGRVDFNLDTRSNQNKYRQGFAPDTIVTEVDDPVKEASNPSKEHTAVISSSRG